MTDVFLRHACPYAERLAKVCDGFRRQIEPDPRESDVASGEERDPFGEESGARVMHGLRRRFRDRALVLASDRCFMNCRHCTRRWLLHDADTVRTKDELAACVGYVGRNPEIRDILISGGDPLVLPDSKVMEFVDAFASMPQIEAVRLCTRAPCANPERVTEALAQMLRKSGKVWVNTQFNCAGEITPEAAAACARLVDCGLPVSCQTVLLAGINDSAGALLDLFRALRQIRVRPYYVFQCDPVAGTSHFRVPLAEAKRIAEECAEKIGGLALPRFVADIPGAKRKVPFELL